MPAAYAAFAMPLIRFAFTACRRCADFVAMRLMPTDAVLRPPSPALTTLLTLFFYA